LEDEAVATAAAARSTGVGVVGRGEDTVAVANSTGIDGAVVAGSVSASKAARARAWMGEAVAAREPRREVGFFLLLRALPWLAGVRVGVRQLLPFSNPGKEADGPSASVTATRETTTGGDEGEGNGDGGAAAEVRFRGDC